MQVQGYELIVLHRIRCDVSYLCPTLVRWSFNLLISPTIQSGLVDLEGTIKWTNTPIALDHVKCIHYVGKSIGMSDLC
jgi:hypothetical protein